MSRTQFRFIEKRDCFVVYLGKKKFGTITPSAVEYFFGRGGLRFIRKRAVVPDSSAKKETSVEESGLPDEVYQFAKFYVNKMREKPRWKNAPFFVEEDKEFKHFVKAVEMIERHNVSFDDFLQAQIDGLDFANNGQGAWPTPSQLSTRNAETRLLQFLEKGEQQKKGKWVVTKKDKETELTKNERYLYARSRVEQCVASLEETLFVRDLQQARRGKIEFYVKEYLDVLQD